MASTPEAALAMNSGTASGESDPAPRSRASGAGPRSSRSRRSRSRRCSRSARCRAGSCVSQPDLRGGLAAGHQRELGEAVGAAPFLDGVSEPSRSAQGARPSTIPVSPAHQRSSRGSAPRPSGLTAPTPVIATRSRIGLGGPRSDQLDRVADGLHATACRRARSSTPYSSSMIWASSARSSESTSISSQVASRPAGARLDAELDQGRVDPLLDRVAREGDAGSLLVLRVGRDASRPIRRGPRRR